METHTLILSAMAGPAGVDIPARPEYMSRGQT